MLEIFKNNAFGVVPLTDAINSLKYVPGRIGQLGLFMESGVAATSVMIEEKNGQLSLISPTPRGGPGVTVGKTKRGLRSLAVPHFEVNDAIMAEEVQGVRAWGSETELETVQDKVSEQMSVHVDSYSATQEYSRIGAIKGVVTYSDGTTLNLFTEFGVVQEGEIDFDLDNANPNKGALRRKCAGLVRQMSGILDGVPYASIHAFCGDSFFDDLLAHPEVIDSYKNTSMAQVLREGYVLPNGNKIYGAFEFGGIVWENYRGSVGGTAFVNTDKCHLLPLGVPRLFRTYYAPADYLETVNTMGKRLYVKQYEMPNGKGVHFDTQMNALELCTRPKTLIQGKRT